MATPWRWRTPEQRLADLRRALDREGERSVELDEVGGQREQELQRNMQVELQREAALNQRDDLGQQMQAEEMRSSALDIREAEQPRRLGREGRRELGLPLGPAVPGEAPRRVYPGGEVGPTITPELQAAEVSLAGDVPTWAVDRPSGIATHLLYSKVRSLMGRGLPPDEAFREAQSDPILSPEQREEAARLYYSTGQAERQAAPDEFYFQEDVAKQYALITTGEESIGAGFFKPMLPEPVYETIEKVGGPFGPSMRREAEFLTSPGGVVTAAAFPQFTALGGIGGIGAGGFANIAGAPPGVELGAQLAGNILMPGAGLVPARAFAAPARGGWRAGQGLMGEAVTRARLAPEAGGVLGRRVVGPGVPGGRLRRPSAEGMHLTNDLPTTTAIRQRLADVDAALAQPKVKGGRPAMLTERAKLQAQADIDDILASGQPVEEQLDLLTRELEELQGELQTRSLPFRGRWAMRRKFVPPEKDMRMGGPTAEELAARPSGVRRREAADAAAYDRYPDLSTAEVNARERVYAEFVESARFEPVEEALVGQTRFTPEGEIVREPTYATEAELAGIRPRQAELGIGPGERPIETAGPMFREGGPPASRESAMIPPQAEEATPRLGAPEVREAVQTGDVHNAFQRMVTGSLEDGGLPPRKPPYTAARTGPPDMPGGALNAASGAPPGRIATDLWRLWEGRMNEAIDRIIRLEGGDTYKLARQQKLKISKTRTPEMEDVMEKFWLRAPAESFDESWRPIAKKLYGMLDEEEALMLAADPSFSNKLLDKYFPHLFRPRGLGGMPPPGKLGQRPGFLRERRLKGPLGEILEANPNLDLFSWDPVDFVLRRRLAGEQYRANLEVLQRMRAQGLALKRSAAPADWVVPNAPAFQPRAIPGRPDMFTSPIAVPKEVGKVLDDWYGTSFMTTSAAFNLVRRGAITAKFTKVFGGLFQYFDYTMRTLGIAVGYQDVRGIPGAARGWARAWVPGIDRKLLRFDIQDPVRNRLIKDGLNVRGPTDIVEATFRQNYGEDVLPIPLLKQMTEFITSRSYTGLHREMVLTNAETLFRHYTKVEGMAEAAASVRAVRKTHEFFSTLPAWQSIWRSPGMRDVIRTFGLFSMGETEGWFRNFFRLFQPTQAKDAARFWFGMMTMTAAFANGINMAVTGKPLGVDQWLPFTYDKDDRRGIPFIGYNTHFMRPELPFEGPYGRKEYLDLLGQADTPFRWALDPVFGLQTRLAQYPQWIINALLLSKGEKPLFGPRPQTPQEYGGFAVGQVAPIPAMGFLQERERIGLWGGGIQSAGFNVSSEPLRNVIARRFEEKHGRPFNPETDFRIIGQDEGFKAILAELNRLGLEFESKGALRAQAIERTRLQFEESTGLVTTAQGIAAGKPGAEAEFAYAFDDYNAQMVGAYAVTYLDVEDRRETPEGKALQAYLTLEMEAFRDPETLEVDRDAFYAEKDRLFAELPRDLQKAIEAALKSENPLVRRYEPEYQKAKGIRNEIYEQPKYPIDPEKEKVLMDFLDFVRQEWERGKRQYGEDFPSLPELARLIGRQNNERWLGENAADVFSGKAPLNKGRIDLALKYQDILSRYFPDVIRRVLPVEIERTELGEGAFERITAR